MSDETSKLEWAVLPPGSPDAVAAGCRCPILDNASGQGAWIGTSGSPGYWVSQRCPLHVPPLYGRRTMSERPSIDQWRVRGWYRRLQVLFTGRTDSIEALAPPVVYRENAHGYSLDYETFGNETWRYSWDRPMLRAVWRENEHEVSS